MNNATVEPTQAELKAAKWRLGQMDTIVNDCAFEAGPWGIVQNEKEARARYFRLLDAQSEFESKYY